jgi:hypothetical protein
MAGAQRIEPLRVQSPGQERSESSRRFAAVQRTGRQVIGQPKSSFRPQSWTVSNRLYIIAASVADHSLPEP